MRVLFSGIYYYLYWPAFKPLSKHFEGDTLILTQIKLGRCEHLANKDQRTEMVKNGFEILDLGKSSWPNFQGKTLGLFKKLYLFLEMIKSVKTIEKQIDMMEIDAIVMDSDLSMEAHILNRVAQKNNIPVFVIQTCLADFVMHSNDDTPWTLRSYLWLNKTAKKLMGVGYLNNNQTVFGKEFDNAHVFVWGRIFKNYYRDQSVISVGNLAFDSLIEYKYKNHTKIKNDMSEATYRKKVLICSDAIHEVLGCSEEKILEIYKAVFKMNPTVDFKIKVHPRENSDNYKIWFEELKNVMISKDDNLYNLLQEADVQVSFMSTTSIEALAFGVPTLLLEVPGEKHIETYQEAFFKNVSAFARYDRPEEISAHLVEIFSERRQENKREHEKRLKDLFNRLDGNSSLRAYREIKKVLNETRGHRCLIRGGYGLNRELTSETAIALFIGLDYEGETEKIFDWLNEYGCLGDRVVNFSHAVKSQLEGSKWGESTYFKDLINQSEELNLFKQAYKRADEVSKIIEQSFGLEFVHVAAALQHSWAYEFYKGLCFNFLREKYNNSKERIIAVFDNPFFTEFEYLEEESLYLKYLTKGEERYPYDDVTGDTEEILQACHKRYIEELQTSYDESPYCIHAGRKAVSKPILVVSDDSGSMINTTSVKAIVAALKDEGYDPLYLTSTENDFGEMKKLCSRYYRVPNEIDADQYSQFTENLLDYYELFDAIEERHLEFEWQLFVAVVKPRLFGCIKTVTSIENTILHLKKVYDIKDVLAIGEGNFLPAAALSFSNDHQLMHTWGVSPVLYMDHPMCSHWPAQTHFVYGEHGAEIMIQKDVSRESIISVGTEHFDRCKRRNKEDDWKLIQKKVPIKGYEKIVVVATENRARQWVEIEPTLDMLSTLENVMTVVKLHPSDDLIEFEKRVVSKNYGNNILVIKDIDVQALIHVCDLVITMGSNLVIEAAIMKTPSLCYNFSGEDCPIDFVKEGLSFGVFSAEELENTVKGLLYDEKVKAQAQNKLELISKFNGPNDGNSAKRIAQRIGRTQ